MIGCLHFLSHQPRPAKPIAAGILSQFVGKPTALLKENLKQVFGYPKRTRGNGLRYDVSEKTMNIPNFNSDADLLRNKINRKSRSEWIAKC